MQAELAFRPTRADIDDLTAVVGKLRSELLAREQQIERMRISATSTIREKNTAEKGVETGGSLEDLRRIGDDDSSTERSIDTGKISAEIDEMFRLDYEDDEETDSAVTEINREEFDAESPPTTEAGEADEADEAGAEEGEGVISAAGEFVRLDDGSRLQVTLQNGSLHALEEELVRAKESWAEVCAERARLAAQLELLQHKAPRLQPRLLLALAVPLLAAALYYVLLLPHVS